MKSTIAGYMQIVHIVLKNSRYCSHWKDETNMDNLTPLQIAQHSKSKCRQEIEKMLIEETDEDSVPHNSSTKAKCESLGQLDVSIEVPKQAETTGSGLKRKKRKSKKKKETMDEIELDDEQEGVISRADLSKLVKEIVASDWLLLEESQLNQTEELYTEPEKKIHTVTMQEEGEIDNDTEPIPPGLQEETILCFDNEPWEIELHENVKRFICNKKQPAAIRHKVVPRLYKLASGDWNIDLCKPLKSETGIIVYEAKLTESARILYQISIRFSDRETERIKCVQIEAEKPIHIYTQAITVWEVVLNHKRIDEAKERIIKAIQNLHSTDHQENLNPLEVNTRQGPLRLPQLFLTCTNLKPLEQDSIIKQLTSKPQSIDWEIKENDIGAKMYSLTRQLALSFLDDENERKDYPIKATDEEHDIIMLPSSEPIVVLGRSGTGKTTTCLNRIWLNFKNYWMLPDRINNPYFLKPVKESRLSIECGEGESHSTDTALNTVPTSADKHLGGEQASSCDLLKCQTNNDKDILSSRSQCQEFEHLHQVFITKNHALCAKMKKRFFDFVGGCKETKDHLLYEECPLPGKLTEIEHFPIFLTSRQFFNMLDNSLDDGQEYFKAEVQVESSLDQADSQSLNLLFELSDSESDDDSDVPERQRRNRKPKTMREITASEFAANIWPQIRKHSPEHLRQIDPLLIWTEIESFIKGSFQAVHSENGYISKTDYCKKIGERQAYNFPLDRGEVYKLFQQYNHEITHVNISSHRFDNGHFIWNLNKRLHEKYFSKSTAIPWSIHEIYIDEVQDFTQAELCLILKCCRDPNRSFLSGDTAQTIMQGIAFTFQEVKTLFRNLGPKLPWLKCRVPEIKTLTVNHRSPSTITKLATSLTDILKHYFPDAFDWYNIPSDESNIKGTTPLFICSKTVLENFLMPKGCNASSSIEFGADQVVIARDSSEERKEKMPEYLQDEIVLNPQECKGLEFNDVLLYNFFTDTPNKVKVVTC